MIALPWQRPLAGLSLASVDGGLALHEAEPRSLLRLEVPAAEKAAVMQGLGLPLPRPGIAHAGTPVHGPSWGRELAVLADRGGFLVVGELRLAGAIAAELASVLAATEHQLVDLSHALVALVLTGTVDPVLARTTGIDLRQFQEGDVVKTSLARCPATLWRREGRCEVIVAASGAAFVAAHLAHAGRAYGLPPLSPVPRTIRDGG